MSDTWIFLIREGDWDSDGYTPDKLGPDRTEHDETMQAHAKFAQAVEELGVKITGGQALSSAKYGGWVDVSGDEPVYTDAYFGHHGGRAFLVAAASGVSVSAVGLPAHVSPLTVQPRRIPPIGRLPEIASGDGGFDHLFRVATAGTSAHVVLTPQLRAAAMAHDDWILHAAGAVLACVGRLLRTPDDVTTHVAELTGLVGAPAPQDVVARARALRNMGELIAFVVSLSPDDRQRLARSDTPPAIFADLTTPDAVMNRFKALTPAQRVPIMNMWMDNDPATPRRRR